MEKISPDLENFCYRPEIDGLRALAVLPVLLFHAGLGMRGGFMGVDIFFVISGYLITTLIARDLQLGCFKMRDFWERRIRRILPAAAVMVIATLIAGAIILLPQSFENLGQSALAQSLMVSNFYFWQQDGYFAAPSDYEALLHTWSLAVEEQFYLVLPALLVFLNRKFPARITVVLGLVFLTSMIWSFFGPYLYPTASFYLLPARAWELLLGSLIAIFAIKVPGGRLGAEFLSLAGIVLMVYPMLTYVPTTPFPGVAAISPCLGAALFILATRKHGTLARQFLSLSPFVFIGKISYSLYLWHWPLLVFGRHLSIHETSLENRLVLLIASFALAILSWRYVETPFRRPGLLAGQKQTFIFFYVATFIIAVAGTFAYKTDGLPVRFDSKILAVSRVSDEKFDAPDNRNLREDGKIPRLEKTPDVKPTIMVWGDSHAKAALPVFRDLCQHYQTDILYACKGGTPPILGIARKPLEEYMTEYNDAVFEALQKEGIKTIILIARWGIYPQESTSFFSPNITYRTPNGSSPEVVFETQLRKTIKQLRAKGMRVVIMKQVPFQRRSVPQNIVNAVRFGRNENKIGVSVEDHLKHQEYVNGVIDSLGPYVTILDPLPILRNGNRTRISQDGKPLYRDADHLSFTGSQILRPIFEPIFKNLSSSSN
jgi:peptidoglycan/LPS O-acetylase OafA/YrhL